jgi:hypothetical protein
MLILYFIRGKHEQNHFECSLFCSLTFSFQKSSNTNITLNKWTGLWCLTPLSTIFQLYRNKWITGGKEIYSIKWIAKWFNKINPKVIIAAKTIVIKWKIKNTTRPEQFQNYIGSLKKRRQIGKQIKVTIKINEKEIAFVQY